MTKVEINNKTYCVETLIYAVERLTKDVKASAEYHRFVLDMIKDEINALEYLNIEDGSDGYDKYIDRYDVLQIIDKYKSESESKK